MIPNPIVFYNTTEGKLVSLIIKTKFSNNEKEKYDAIQGIIDIFNVHERTK